MTSTAPPADLVCPSCTAPLTGGEGAHHCTTCDADVRVVLFRPVLDGASLDAGEGRCLNHPGKDALDACERCGAYLCDVCLTRTGEQVLCPGCFELLHTRGELVTTRSRRFRIDRACLPLTFVALVACSFLLPIPMALSVYVLWRSRREPWMERRSAIWSLALTLIPITLAAVVFAVEMAK